MKIIPVILLVVALCVNGNAKTRHSSSAKTINGSGCVERAAEHSCHVVIDTQTGQTYSLMFSDNGPKSGTAIWFKGTVRSATDSCLQAKAVSVSKWKKEKGIRCPPPPQLVAEHRR